MVATSPDTIGGRYKLGGLIGQGGTSRVYHAYDRLTRSAVALKYVSQPLQNLQFHGPDSITNPHLALAKEFQILAALRHPHIISVLDFGFASIEGSHPQPYFTMELLEDSQTIVQFGLGKPRTVQIQLILQLLQALVYLHRQNILHHDLKPENVLVSPTGTVKVLDFGISSRPGNVTSDVESRDLGTLPYLAPECLLQEVASQPSDLYAVGVIAYEILLGAFPYHRANTAYLVHDIQNKVPDTGNLPPSLGTVIDTLLAKRPEERYASASEVMDALSAAVGLPRPPETTALRESFLRAALFVDRDVELARLLDALSQARVQKRGSAWLIGGESGVGKSRLLSELRTRALVDGALVLTGQAIAEGGLPGYMWREPLRHLVVAANPPDELAGILRLLVRDIDRLLEREIPRITGIDFNALVPAVISLFRQLKQKPQLIVMILEDLHWCTPESLDLLRQVAAHIADLPVLLIGSYRDDEAPALPHQLPGLTPLKLQRLNESEIADLSASMLGTIGQNPDLVSFLLRHTEGNAFFLVEVVRLLAEEAGALDTVTANTLPDTILPAGIEGVIKRRLRRVSPDGYPLLKLATIAGRQIDLRLMQALAPDRVMSTWLLDCASVLEVYDDQWRFAHDKLREALLAEMSADELQTLSRQVALAIEAIYPNDASYVPALIHYWAQAGDRQKELGYLYRTSTQPPRSGLFHDMVRYAERGLALLDELNTPNLDSRRALFLLRRGEGSVELADLERAEPSLRESLSIYQQLQDQQGMAAAYAALGNFLVEKSGRYEEAVDYLEHGITVARRIGDLNALSLLLLVMMRLSYGRGRFSEALAYIDEHLILNRENLFWAGWELSGLGNIYLILGRFQEAENALRQCQESAHRVMNSHLEFTALVLLGFCCVLQGRYDEAANYFNQVASGDREESASPHRTHLRMYRANLSVGLGDTPRAEAYFRQAFVLAEKTHNLAIQAACERYRGLFEYHTGNQIAAQAHLQRSLELSDQTKADYYRASSLCYLGWSQLAQARIADAEPLLRQALALALAMNAAPLLHEILIGLAERLRQQSELANAASLIGFVTEQDYVPHPYGRRFLEQVRQRLLEVLPYGEFEAHQEHGAGKTLDEALALIAL